MSDELKHANRLVREMLAEIEQLKVERDKARRLACKAQTHNHPTGYTKEEYAKNQGWDCFESEEK